VPVAWVDVDEEHATRILLADNKTNDLAEYNNEALASLLTELSESSDLGGTGFTVTDLDLLLADINGADFEPGGELEQGRLDKLEAQFVTCPKCNHEFVSK
jgi:hypothetical protein